MDPRPPLSDVPAVERPGELRLGLAAAGELRWAVTDLIGPLEELRRGLDLAPTAAVALARAAAAAVLLLRFDTKRPGRLRLEVAADGPLGRITVEVDAGGRLRGRVGAPRFAGFDDGRLDIGRAVGAGQLQVTQELVGREPYVSRVQLVDGEIGNDLVHFLSQSRQVRSAALLGVALGRDGLTAAGGLLVEALPGASEEAVAALEGRIAGLDGVGSVLAAEGLDGLAAVVLGDADPVELERQRLVYRCNCSREALIERLASVPLDDLRELATDDGLADVECAFCSRTFVFSLDELAPH